MPNEQLLQRIREWQGRLTGLPESSLEGLDLQGNLDLIAQWHASKVVAEQMVVLTVARMMVEHGLTGKGVASYFGSREAKATALGRFNFVTGIAEWPGMVARVLLPLLKVSGYRPTLRYDVAKAVFDLCILFTVADRPLRPNDVADTLYRRGLSPYVAKRTLRTMKAFGESDPEATRRLWQALSAVREQAVQTIVDAPEIGERIEGLEPATACNAASADGGAERTAARNGGYPRPSRPTRSATSGASAATAGFSRPSSTGGSTAWPSTSRAIRRSQSPRWSRRPSAGFRTRTPAASATTSST